MPLLLKGRELFCLLIERHCSIIAPCRQVGSTGGFLRNCVQKRGVIGMTNVELLSILLSIAGLVVGVFALAISLKR